MRILWFHCKRTGPLCYKAQKTDRKRNTLFIKRIRRQYYEKSWAWQQIGPINWVLSCWSRQISWRWERRGLHFQWVRHGLYLFRNRWKQTTRTQWTMESSGKKLSIIAHHFLCGRSKSISTIRIWASKKLLLWSSESIRTISFRNRFANFSSVMDTSWSSYPFW